MTRGATLADARAQLQMHAHTATYIQHTELINFLTHSQKFISETQRICSCKCDEKPLNAQISESITPPPCQSDLILSFSISHVAVTPAASLGQVVLDPNGS